MAVPTCQPAACPPPRPSSPSSPCTGLPAPPGLSTPCWGPPTLSTCRGYPSGYVIEAYAVSGLLSCPPPSQWIAHCMFQKDQRAGKLQENPPSSVAFFLSLPLGFGGPEVGGPACRLKQRGKGEAFAIGRKYDQLLKSQVDKYAKSVKWHPVPSGGDSKHRWTKQSANYISEDAKY